MNVLDEARKSNSVIFRCDLGGKATWIPCEILHVRKQGHYMISFIDPSTNERSIKVAHSSTLTFPTFAGPI